MSKTPRALWHINSSESIVRDATVPDSDPNRIEIESHYSLVSTGTERLVATGKVPVSLYEEMRVPFMDGDFSFPVKYGYSLTGVETKTNRKVHLMHPHQNKCVVHKESLTYLPDGVPLKRGTLYSNLETAVNAIWDSRILPGERVGVVGFGIIGALVAVVARKIPGCEITVFETDQNRVDLAHKLGFTTHRIHSCDVTFHCSATSPGLQAAIDSVGQNGRVIELSWYGNQSVDIALGGDFHTKRKKIISSQVGKIAGHVPFENKYARRQQLVLDLLTDDSLDDLITHTVSLDQAPDLFSEIRAGSLPGLGYCIEY